MSNIARSVEQADLDTYAKDSHAYNRGSYDIHKVLFGLPGDHVSGIRPRTIARLHAKSPATIYDSSFDRSRHGRLRAAALITIMRLGLRTTSSFDDILAPTDSESFLKTYGQDAYAYLCCMLHPRGTVSKDPYIITEMDARKFWDQHPETRETAAARLLACNDFHFTQPGKTNPFLFDNFKSLRTPSK